MDSVAEKTVEELFDELIGLQHEKLFKLARRLIPHITGEDLLQPNDFPELEENPVFRYEEGVWAGLLEAKTAYFQFKKN